MAEMKVIPDKVYDVLRDEMNLVKMLDEENEFVKIHMKGIHEKDPGLAAFIQKYLNKHNGKAIVLGMVLMYRLFYFREKLAKD